MATHLEMISNQSLTEQKMGIITGLPQVLLIATQSHMISEHDFANARRMVQQSVDRFPDLYYFFLTNSQRLADDLIYGTVTHGDQRNTQYHVINENNIQIEHFERKLLEKMRKLPRRILAPFCTNDMSNRRRFEEGLLIKLVQISILLLFILSVVEIVIFVFNTQRLSRRLFNAQRRADLSN